MKFQINKKIKYCIVKLKQKQITKQHSFHFIHIQKYHTKKDSKSLSVFKSAFCNN